jgi:hypothetical protein
VVSEEKIVLTGRAIAMSATWRDVVKGLPTGSNVETEQDLSDY